MAIVYQATNLVNGKRYIGVTNKPLAVRRYSHHYDARKGRKKTFSRAIRKYGEAAFEWKVLHDYLFPEDAMQAEIHFVEKLKPEYNMTAGGDGTRGLKMSAESRAKMAASHTPERKAAFRQKVIGRKNTPEAISRMRQAHAGKPNLKLRGRKCPEHVREISRRTGLKYKDEFIRRTTGVPKGNERCVICVTDGKEFDSASSAARHYGVGKSSIIETCLGKDGRLTVGGMVFQYKDHPVVRRASKKFKLTRENVLEIKGLFGTISHGKIAKRYGVARVTIIDIAAGRSWKGVK